MAVRRKLGRHSKARDKAVLAYSRDELSEPLRLLKTVTAAVNSGKFDPDASRSGLWVDQTAQSEASRTGLPVPEAGPPAQEGDPADIFGDDLGDDHGDADATPNLNRDNDSDEQADSTSSSSDREVELPEYVVNAVNGMYHLRDMADQTRLKCGKSMHIFRDLRGADHAAVFAAGSERCDGCFR